MTKRALILGGSSGIGKATAKKIAATFDEIVIVHRDRRQGVSDLEKFIEDVSTTENCTFTTHNIDATDKEKMLEVIQANDKPFQLVLHAITRGNLGSLDITQDKPLRMDDLKLTMDAMCFNVQLWNELLHSNGLLTRGSRFITLTSEGSTRSWPGYAAVGMAKASLETLTKYLAVEMSSHGVLYNCIHAGVTDTPSLRLIPGYDELVDFTKKRNPYHRLTQPEDVANAIYLLTQPEANWINGSIIHVDGGEHLV
ncbi:MAG: short-chain dehydrogenase [Rickettsiales bacterium]|nr:short-chain dehydrogenase [Rickettsiales bacterium]